MSNKKSLLFFLQHLYDVNTQFFSYFLDQLSHQAGSLIKEFNNSLIHVNVILVRGHFYFSCMKMTLHFSGEEMQDKAIGVVQRRCRGHIRDF